MDCAQGEIAVLQVDLADLASVHAMTRTFLAKERGPDLLVRPPPHVCWPQCNWCIYHNVLFFFCASDVALVMYSW